MAPSRNASFNEPSRRVSAIGDNNTAKKKDKSASFKAGGRKSPVMDMQALPEMKLASGSIKLSLQVCVHVHVRVRVCVRVCMSPCGSSAAQT
jgi:hypothetical protein